MRYNKYIGLAFSILIFCFINLQINCQDEERVSVYAKQNRICFRCHANHAFEEYNKYSDVTTKRIMCDEYRIDSTEYYVSNHWSFACVDCHSYDYEVYPHSDEARMEGSFVCIDCHGYDENYAQFHFEEIDEEFQQSIHYNANEEDFNCWKCHNPHSYKISARTNENIRHTIAYDNDICLSCHADFDRFQLLTERESIDIIQHHNWLPNQTLHFRNVRCIECHTQINDSILIAHLVLPKEQAVHRCTECHSQDSRLLSTLYKFQSKEARADTKVGFANPFILKESYVIGANRNVILNKVSVIIFVFVIAFIAMHTILRIIIKKN
ncbi:cytochrome c3 family protein [Bacteroidota bacterium]